jgi:hypothetical protein
MGVPRGKIRPHAVDANGESFTIWGDTDKLSEFFAGIAEAPNTSGPDRTVQMPQMIVKRYPSDPGFTRRAHTRRVTADNGIKRGTTPGKVFMCEEAVLNAATGNIETKVTQFTYTGTTLQLRAYARSKAKLNFTLRWQSGRFEAIKTAAGPTTLGAHGTDQIRPLVY